ncbi:diazepam-binding inhibitor (GABA receptor modulator, acyl-CoA-binding protein) [Cladophialophora psammophila CBS 110553]|uniref:Diazepam-binding inhibitor (GABA receptor modulator, acyl-CoA-binding protein) n=1 Tax=Cladophialophora psammophila CBS 110553 TaxID=1182543 RepID=W9VH34_9EURO|nr:diazepam-binding inhibitor (GABA receptor modulator, acyl-CoA-binding protein) [Cladophialophora psammophila CBS 110553]EXJ54942.1 diazepam-binding inhibitor (GABA receptor modulator, acyl-CoA-binding protein) [Cladophialophora psammophila CBS 110553]
MQLYALFKVANGEDITKAPAPGMFDLKGKAKYKAWQKEVDAGTSAQEAEAKYIKLVESLKEKYGFDPSKVPEAVGSNN